MNLKTINKQRRFTESFKRSVVEEYYSTNLSLQELSEKHGLLGHSTLSNWLHKYSKDHERVNSPNNIILETVKKSTKTEKDEYIKKLEQALEASEDRTKALELFIQLSEKELGIKLPKKPFTKRSKS